MDPFAAFHLISMMSQHVQNSLSYHQHSHPRLDTDPLLYYKACLQQHQLKMGSMNRYSGAKKRVIMKRPIYPLTMTLIPQARWKVIDNHVVSRSRIVVAKALYHRVLKK